MATIVALTSNNWSSTTSNDPWPGGTKPGSGDTVQTGAYVIEIDQDITVVQLEATSTGYFTVTAIAGDGTRTITAAVLNSGSAEGALQITAATGDVVVIGTGTGGTSYKAHGIANSGTITTLTGNVTGSSGSESAGIYNAGTITTLTGDVTGGSGGEAIGVYNTGTITTLTGDVIGGSGEYTNAILNTGTITTLTGDVTGGSAEKAIGIVNSGTITTLTGDVTGGSGDDATGITGYVETVTGAVTGGSGGRAFGILSYDARAIDIDGVLVCDSSGLLPISGAMRLVAAATNAITFIDTTDAELVLSNDYPAVADVKDGVTYKLGTLEGELTTGGISHVTVVIGGNVTRWT